MPIILIGLILIIATTVHTQTLLAAGAPSAEQAAHVRNILDAPIPADLSKAQLAELYEKRVLAAMELGDSARELNELISGIRAVGAEDPDSYYLHNRLANHYADRGSPRAVRDAREAALKVAANPGQQIAQLNHLAGNYLRFGEVTEAKTTLDRLDGVLSSARAQRNAWARFGALHQGRVANAKSDFNYQLGYLTEAQSESRKCITFMKGYLGTKNEVEDLSYYYLVECSGRLLDVLLQQGRLKEAGPYVNELKQQIDAYTDQQKRRLFAPRMARYLVRAYIDQGLFNEAKELLDETLPLQLDENEGEASTRAAATRRLLALLEMIKGNWTGADGIFRARSAGIRSSASDGIPQGERPAEWGYTLLRLGRAKDALDMLDGTLRSSTRRFTEKSLYLWEARAFHALAAGANGQRETAIKTLSLALPKILDNQEGTSLSDAGILYGTRLTWLLDGYIALLADLHHEGKRVEGIDSVAEMYRLADLARGSKVQGALAAAILRASVNDSELANLIRKNQDLDFQILQTAEQLSELQTRKDNPKVRALLADAKTRLAKFREESDRSQAELKRRLPDYSALLSPKPLSLLETQKALRPQEALISIYSTEKNTLVWSVPAHGQVSFSAVNLSAAKMSELVNVLRKALDPSDVAPSQIPSFEYAAAHELFLKLLMPVSAGWNSAKELIIVPHGPLGQLPFSVLITSPYKPVPTGMLFSEHSDAPWLLKQAAISYLPSVAALGTLRRTSTQKAARSFVGFADPIFSGSDGTTSLTRGIARRFLKRSSSPEVTGTAISPLNLSLLQSLPDTATEVGEIAKILSADDKRDIFVGKRASEQMLKSIDLAQYRTVMFATHGLTAGELPGLDQPALALSNPAVTGEKEDGVLYLNEILELKLNADWVVLSACNTASNDGKAAEGISGLGRAFFYAGAKALLVSHWAVETVSARLLTTEIFRRQAANTNLSRAEAMRQSSLSLIQEFREGPPASAYSYAHPMFWAPFVVVGDGGQ